ncbi:dTDP-4-dehydrorhamnose reductase [Hymenobacter ginsengisoli]|uniref:dTDP-4-dehydrorhamnose reductase n=1 Tax=Hymenobacter ginsengisoli TaxID=1051626 RepID=A0ABP8QBB8_9BACT|nr:MULTISPECIES: NAD(P)-dependent oxidoreductase [unclassified Hymenobacter]MBO2030700.1 NAD(P)-dependent oxidoreductase [Hymenobacter sp. BT559]
MSLKTNSLASQAPTAPTAQSLLITGRTGTLGRAFRKVCHIRGLAAVCLGRDELDIADADAIAQALERYQPWAVVNAAGYVRVDDAEADTARCYRENAVGPALLAQACATHGIQLLTFSSDLVFDGQQAQAYLETDRARPLNVYGHSKLQAEQAVLAHLPSALVVRTSAFFGAWDSHNFVHHALAAARAGQPFAAADDLLISPTYVPDLVNTALDLLLDEERGIWHLTNHGTCTWAELARQAVCAAGLDTAGIVPRPAASFGWAAVRPGFSALRSQQGILLPSIESGLQRYLTDEQLLQSASPPAVLVD